MARHSLFVGQRTPVVMGDSRLSFVTPFPTRIPMGGGDSPEYATLAQDLLNKEHLFTMNIPGSIHAGDIPNYRLPLFMAIAMLIYKSYFTVSAFFADHYGLAFFVIIFEIGEKLFTPLVGFIAALCFMLDPTVIFCTMVIFDGHTFRSTYTSRTICTVLSRRFFR